MEKATEKMNRAIKRFEICQSSNIITTLTGKVKESVLLRWLIACILIGACLFDWFIMMRAGVLYDNSKPSLIGICLDVLIDKGTINKKYTFINDVSNSISLTVLYLVSYFASIYYPGQVKEFIELGLEKIEPGTEQQQESIRKKYNSLYDKVFLAIGGILGIIFGSCFFFKVVENGANVWWLSELCDFYIIYHWLFLCAIWYISITLLIMAYNAAQILHWSIISRKINYIDDDYNKNISIIKAYDTLVSTFSVGMFYVIGSILIVFNDQYAKKYNVKNTFSDEVNIMILIAVIIAVIVFLCIPLKTLFEYMKEKKNDRIIYLNNKIEKINNKKGRNYLDGINKKKELINERNNILENGLLTTSFNNKIVLVSSVLIPLIGIIIQAINVFK